MHQISHLFIPVVSLLILFNFSFAVDSLTPTETLSDGQTLVSSGQRFELGFFSPGNSTKRYLGIWYKKTPSIVVWVANRNHPVMGSSGLLMIRNGGELAVVNGTKNIFWSSGSTGLAQNPMAQILYTGNFVVMERNEAISGRYIWQSFDYPTDTRLPGAMMGRNLSKGQDIYLSSWKTADDPSRGNFAYRFDFTGLPQLVLEEGSIRKYRTGPWNGLSFSGAVRYNTSIILPSVVVFDNQKSGYMYQPYSSSVVTRAVISPSGLVNWYLLDQGSNGWNLLQSAPSDPCDTYGRCGANGFCRVMKQSACECLKGFTPKFPDKWQLLDWSAGCMRSVPLNCGEKDGFFKLVGVKFPDLLHVWLDNSLNLKQCEAKCLSNCSCTAYANSNVSGGGSGCLLWFGDLMDITDSIADDTEQEVHLRLPASELRSVGTSTKKIHVLIVVLSVTSGMLILVFLVWLILRMRQIHAKGEDLFAFDFNISARATRTDQTEGEKPKRNITELEIPVFSFSSVSVCTNNFSSSNKIGEGGFGPVYKGNLLMGHVAVKRLSGRSVQGWDELKNEAVLIAKLQHKNLVRLLGCCIEGDENILIYEYLANKSLDIFLFDSTKPGSLDWRTRSRIIEGVAQGLLYLHEYSRLKIIHRDLKASNILLDKDMNPKISDFGMARIFGGGDQGETKRIVGTYGYMAPEYALHGIFSVKSDVFSFGVLVLEILSGKKNTHFYNSDCLNLLGYAWDLWSSGRPLELRDPSMSCDTADALFVRHIKIALLCVQEHATDRPTMSEVVSMLSNQQLSLPYPKRPAFSSLRSPVKPTISDESSSINCSTNLVTLSIVQAR